MQDVPHDSLLADMAQRDISYVLNGVRGVVTRFDDPRLFQLLQIEKPFLARRNHESPDSTYHTLFGFEVFIAIELGLVFIMTVGLFSAHPEPLT